MRTLAPSPRHSHGLSAILATLALVLGLVPAFGLQPAAADEAGDGLAQEVPLVAASQLSREVALQPLSEGEGVPLVADALAGKPTCFVNQEVLLDDNVSVIGSFTVDGMTYAVTGEGTVELVAVAPAVLADDLVAGLAGAAPVGSDGAPSGEDSGSGVPTSPSPSPEGASSDDAEGEDASELVVLEITDSVEHDGVIYSVTSIGPRTFVSCGADVVRIPASVASVDEAAFRGSSVGSVEVAEGNPDLASYEGVLYDAGFNSLLLIPEGKKGVVRIHSNTSAITPEAFSHCASVTSVEVDAGNEAFYVEDGKLHKMVASWDKAGKTGAEATLGSVGVSTAGLGVYTLRLHCPTGHSISGIALNGEIVRYCTQQHAAWSLVETLTTPEIVGFMSDKMTSSVNGVTGTAWPLRVASTNWSDIHVMRYIDGTSRDSFVTVGSPTGPRLTQRRWNQHTLTYEGYWIETPGTYDLYLHCSSEPQSVSVTWNANGGSTPVGSSSCYAGGTVASPVPTLAGYTSTGWWTAPSGGSRVCAPGAQTPAVSSNVTYYAQWAKKASHKVALEGAGDAGGEVWYWPDKGYATSSSSTSVVAAGSSIREPLSRLGWEFGGWWTGAGGTGALCIDEHGRLAPTAPALSGPATFYAKWSLRAFEVTLDLDGGELSAVSASGWERGGDGLWRRSYSIESDPFALPRAVSKAGYASFDGWASEAEGVPEPEPGMIWVYPDDLRDQAWQARFSDPIPYEVTLDLAGGFFPEAPEGWQERSGGTWARGFDVESEGFDLPTPAREGHSFLGWAFPGEDGALGDPDPAASVPAGSVGDRAYVASWEAAHCTVTWDYNGATIDGATSATSELSYGDPLPFPARPSEADPGREHYAFVGWFDDPEGGERVEGGPCLAEGALALYARWEPVEYAVWLHLAGGTIEQGGQVLPGDPYQLPYTVEEAVQLPWPGAGEDGLRPVREGMAFAGWVACDEAGEPLPDAVPQLRVELPQGSFGERRYRATWSFALRFEVPASVSFSYDLAGLEDPVMVAEGPEAAFRSRSAGPLAVVGLACEAAPTAGEVVADPKRVSLWCGAASAAGADAGWVPLAAPGALPEAALASLGLGRANPVAPMAELPLRYEASVVRPAATLSPTPASAAVATFTLTVEGLW